MKTLVLLLISFLFIYDLIGQKKEPKKGNTYNTTIEKSKDVNVKNGDVKVNSAENVNVNVYRNELLERIYDEQTGGN